MTSTCNLCGYSGEARTFPVRIANANGTMADRHICWLCLVATEETMRKAEGEIAADATAALAARRQRHLEVARVRRS